MEKVLLGLSNYNKLEEIIESFTYEFGRKGVEVKILHETSFKEIEDYLSDNKDCTILILEDYLEGKIPAKSQYFSRLRKKNPALRIMYLIDNSYYKSSYLEDIYEAKEYNCLFKKDGSIENIVYICLNPRSMDEAKSYYGLTDGTDEYLEVHRGLGNLSGRKYGDKNTNENVIIKEKIIYRTPKDYQKIIGVYSPYSVGKTVLASNLAKYYTKRKLEVTLIDTDYHKKDLIYHFPLDDEDFFKLSSFYNDIEMGKEICDTNLYAIEIGSRLKLFTDHRDSQYEMTFEMLNCIVRKSDSNLIIIDISRDLEPKLVNEILELCDEKIIVTDKMISTLNGLPYKLKISKQNMKNLSLVVNRDLQMKGLTKNRIESYFRNIEYCEDEKYSLEFNNVFFIPNKYELISESIANRDIAFGNDREFDESIIKIANSLYHMNIMSSKDRGLKGLLKIFMG
ncbi:hypothetical protein [Wukongibacter sp. M2B1]|uniref:hypothetical protein n=1 Tax=Wukongibacter sp. M2B1 TaxID=3088895 RepID=UPI003D792E9C